MEQSPEQIWAASQKARVAEPLYVRYYSGHQGRFGHEFLGMLDSACEAPSNVVEFDIRVHDDGRSGILRYANNSNYKNDSLIRKEGTSRFLVAQPLTNDLATLSPAVLDEFKRIVVESEIVKEDDTKWPPRNRDGKQELEIRMGNYHISLEVSTAVNSARHN